MQCDRKFCRLPCVPGSLLCAGILGDTSLWGLWPELGEALTVPETEAFWGANAKGDSPVLPGTLAQVMTICKAGVPTPFPRHKGLRGQGIS
jgi:hypothetical protein